jgi:hypothetical protein
MRAGFVVLAGFLAAGCHDGRLLDDRAGGELPPANEAALAEALRTSYEQRAIDRFETLFHPEYQFLLDVPAEDGTAHWGRTEEFHIHRRLFFPHEIPIDPPPPPPVYVALTLASTPFEEAPEYYRSPVNLDGLDSALWRVTQATFDARILLGTLGDTDYSGVGRWVLVVAMDRSKSPGESGRFLFYRWIDLGGDGVSISRIKEMYR